ncbi:MAG TPA: ATP-binding protein [Ramlibacter sp.]|nr:ATP-binding protein [Ramlibacter sp.]
MTGASLLRYMTPRGARAAARRDVAGNLSRATPRPASRGAFRRRERPRAIAWLWAAMVVSLLGPALLFAYVARTSYQHALNESVQRLGRVAQIAQEHARRVVETNEVISRAVTRHIAGRDNDALRADHAALHEFLRALAAGLPQFQSVWIWDDEGEPIASSLRDSFPVELNVADREYFRWARLSVSTNWFVSQPLTGRTTGQPFFDFSKRRSGGDGDFAGVLSISLFPDYFKAFFEEQVKQDPAFSVSLWRADGSSISRYPEAKVAAPLRAGSILLREMGKGAPSGDFVARGADDDGLRHVAFRKVGDLPLYAVASADRQMLIQAWQRSILLLAAFAFPLSLGICGLCWFALRRVRREHAIAHAHREQQDHRQRAEEALRQAQKLEALGRLTGGVAHDFNNILMVVQSSAALARMLEQRGEPLQAALAPIERAVANGSQLTRQLLAVARRQPLQIRSVQPGEVILPVAALMASTLGSRIEVLTQVEPGLPGVLLDQAEFELALINLCINAKDAMPDGGALVVGAQRADAAPAGGQALVRVFVADQGLGIAAELLDKVCEPFFTTKPIGKGTGLGLSQAHSFVQQSGGELRIESAQGRGTTVSMFLPAAPAPDADHAAGDPQGALAPRLQGGQVLLVEDNADIASALTLLLEHLGATVSHYPTAEAALDGIRARAVAPDIVLSDVLLAGRLSGVDLAHKLAGQRPDLPVVLMTGYTDQLREAASLGFEVLPKPISPHDLATAVARVLAAARRTGPGKS